MASDEDYMAFLDKANRDPSEGYAKTASTDKAEFKTTDEGVQVPAALKKAVQGAVYVTDADEEFVPVALKFNGDKLPDEGAFFSSSSPLRTAMSTPAPPFPCENGTSRETADG